jgi:DNA-binding CsgD family transcriptional regulator
LAKRVPEEFVQVVRRVPVYRDRTKYFVEGHEHPEDPRHDVEARAERGARRSMRLAGPPPDPVWYKWRGDEYVGYDWRSPGAKAWHDRLEGERARKREEARRRRARKRAASGCGSLVFVEWRWVCPGCSALVRKLYYPAPRVSVAPLLDARAIPVRLRKLVGLVGREGEEEAASGAVSTLACKKCHGVHSLSRVKKNAWWNELVGWLTGGLLYGREVKRPAGVVEGEAARRNKYTPQFRGAPKRERVLELLLAGWTKGRIAVEMGISMWCVKEHMRWIFRMEGVRDRHELARKLGAGAQPLNRVEKAKRRRERVMGMMVEGRSYKEMMRELGVGQGTVNRDVVAIYRGYGINGRMRSRGMLLERVGAKARIED